MTKQILSTSQREAWLNGFLLVAKKNGLNPSRERAAMAVAWAKSSKIDHTLKAMAETCGLEAHLIPRKLSNLRRRDLPVLAITDDGVSCLVTEVLKKEVKVCGWADGSYFEEQVAISTLDTLLLQPFLHVEPTDETADKRVDDYAPKPQRDWFFATVMTAKGPMLELTLASFFCTLLAIATSIFSMQIWDRVIPARSIDTLWVLTIGVGMALLLDFGLRCARVVISDHFGKRADHKLSTMMFARMLDISSDARPKNPGSLVAQLRDLDQLRELLTSTTLGVLLDLPFALVLLFIIWFLGSWMVCVPLAAVPLILLPGMLAQLPLAKLSRAGMSEAALRNSILMESIYRIDDIKILQAEERFSRVWQRTNDVSGIIGLRQRFYRALFANWAQTVQQAVYAATLVCGAYAVMAGHLSFGVLTACSMLSTRAISPLTQIASVLSVLQNARVGKAGLDSLMKLPIDHDIAQSRYHRSDVKGHYAFENAVFAYDGAEKPALLLPTLKIKGGDRIALLGRAGSGKSTLLRLLSGLSKVGNGRILLDNTNIEMIDRADLRKAVGLLMQDSGLFFGTLRENLAIAAPSASDEEMLKAMKVACADELLLNQQHGLDLVIRENGAGLSGGQRQVLLLARVILRNPRIVLLDEPTAALDEATERKIVANLEAWAEDRTLVIATHRYPILDIVTRVIVLNGGRIASDGARDEVLAKLRVA